MDLLTPAHPRWDEFANALSLQVDINGCDGDRGQSGDRAHRHAKAVMTNMGNVDIEGSIEFFCNHGGYCDCEILFNVEDRRAAS